MTAIDPEYQAKYQKVHYPKKRKELLAKLGGACKCGATDKLGCYHRDPKEPEPVNLTSFWSWAAGRQEPHLHKLHLLCQNCRPNPNPRKGQLTHGTFWACFKKHCRCEVCEAFRLEHYARHNEARRLLRRTAGISERPIGTRAPRKSSPKKRPILWKDLQVAAQQLVKNVRPKPVEPAQISRAPHGSWHQAINLKCRCDKCKKFVKDC